MGAAAAAADTENLIFSAATTIRAGADDWAYIVWQATDDQLLNERAVAVYAKTGAVAAATAYNLSGIAAVQTDPRTLQLLCNRATLLGEDLGTLETAISSYFQELVLTNSLTLADKLSAVVRGTLSDPEQFNNLVFMARTHPAIAMAIGRAWALPIAAGATTVELRDYAPATGRAGAVIGQVTVLAGSPTVLPAPTGLVEVAETSAQGDLNTRFLWWSPPDLDRAALLNFGYNLYRVTRPYAETRGYHTSAPPRAALADSNIVQVNRSPILIDEDAVTNGTYFFVDDNAYFEGVVQGFTNGAQFYYFVTARDLLGRDGEVSRGCLVTLCDRMPPPAPAGLRATPYYRYQGTRGIKGLTLTWDAVVLTNPGERVTGYYVYRSTNFNAVLYENPAPLAGPIAHNTNFSRFSYTDTNFVSADMTHTHWYVVRAVDNSACGGNYSPNSVPAFGVIRDWEPPARPTNLSVSVICEDVEIEWTYDRAEPHKPGDKTTNFNYRVTTHRDPVTNGVSGIDWVEVSTRSYSEGTTYTTRRYFRPGSSNVVVDIRMTNTDNTVICARAGSVHGQVGDWICKTLNPPDSGNYRDLGVTARAVYTRRIRDTDCKWHVSRIPGSDEDEGVVIHVEVPNQGTNEWAQEWRAYHRLNGAGLTMFAQGLITSVYQAIEFTNDVPGGVNGGEACYYLQLFDRHGNPSPMYWINCVDVTPFVDVPATTLISLEQANDPKTGAPGMRATWNCPPYNVEQFMVCVGADPYAAAPECAAAIDMLEGDFGYRYYYTGRVGADFSSKTSALHSIFFNVETGAVYSVSVVAIGLGNTSGDWSDTLDFTLNLVGTNQAGAGAVRQVPWPPREFPVIQPISFSGTNDVFLPTEELYQPGVTAAGAGGESGGFAPLAPDGTQPAGPAFEAGVLLAKDYALLGGNDVVGVGIGELGGKLITGSPGYYDIVEPAKSTNSVDPMNYLYRDAQTGAGDSSATNLATVFPCVMYRYQVANSNLNHISHDVVQVSPLMENIAYQEVPGVPVHTRILDPFIAIIPNTEFQETYYSIFLIDTQPVIRGATYQYMLVRFADNGEIDRILPMRNVVTIPE